MSGTLFNAPRYTPVNSTGRPRAGSKLYFFRAGTSTPAAVYTTSTLSTAHAVPVVATAAGEFPAIYLDSSHDYKAVLQTSDGVQVWAEDNIPGSSLTDGGDVRLYGAVGDGSTDDTAALQAAVTANREVFLPSGSYKITAPISIPASTRVYGVGRASQIHAWGCHGFAVAAAQDGVVIESLSILSHSSAGAADPRAHDAVRANGASGNAVNGLVCRDLYLRGWLNCAHIRYTWSSRFENVVTVNSDYGIRLFGQSVNNSIDNCELVTNSGEAAIYLEADGSTIGEGLTVSNSLLASGNYGVKSSNGFLSLHLSNNIIDLIQNIAVYSVDIRSLLCVGNWIYAVNRGIQYAALGVPVDVNGAIIGNTIQVTSATGRGVDILGANKGIQVIGGSVNVNGTGNGIFVDGTNCLVANVHLINSGSGPSINLNTTTGNKIGACTGTVTTLGGYQHDYSESTWVPGFATWTGAPTVTAARYAKAGRVVTAFINFTGGTCNDASTITGLPFTSDASVGGVAVMSSGDSSKRFTATISTGVTAISNVPAQTLTGVDCQLVATYLSA